MVPRFSPASRIVCLSAPVRGATQVAVCLLNRAGACGTVSTPKGHLVPSAPGTRWKRLATGNGRLVVVGEAAGRSVRFTAASGPVGQVQPQLPQQRWALSSTYRGEIC